MSNMNRNAQHPVAIVGVGTKTPKGNGLSDLWETLMQHDSQIRTVCAGENDTPVGYASVLPDKLRDGFDPQFWGMTPAQASDLDPQSRWILEGVWNAILDTRSLTFDDLSKMKVGTYCGIMNNDAAALRDFSGLEFSLNAASGGVAGSIAHVFGFHGPCADVNTMCSSGLVCMEFAVDALQKGACDLAIVAAANWIGGMDTFSKVGSINALSKSGLQDAMGRKPDGYIRGEGMVVLVLQPVKDVRQGGTIRCIVEAIASTHHGQGGESKGAAISMNVAVPAPVSYINSYEMCFQLEPRLSKEDIVYIELHATGTVRGDKAELESIRNYFAPGRKFAEDQDDKSESKTLWLGGNKSIFGHTEPVSGLLSIVKLLLAFEKGVVPPTLLNTDPAPDLEEMQAKYNIDIATAPISMDLLQGSLFAVTASGMSGTTTHCIFRPPLPSDLCKSNSASGGGKDRAWPSIAVLATHSADTCKAWRNDCSRIWRDGVVSTDLVIPKNALLYKSRKASATCSVAVFDDSSQLADLLREEPVIRNPPPVVESSGMPAGLILGFGGVGLCQYGVGHRLYKTWPTFRAIIDQLDSMFRTHSTYTLFRDRSVARLCGMNLPEPVMTRFGAQLSTEVMQPATFMVQYAQAAALIHDFNVCVDTVVGHSFGEIVAAAVSGAVTLSAAVTLTLARTQACLALEAAADVPMAMLLCTQLTQESLEMALHVLVEEKKVFVSGIVAEKEFLLSGPRRDLETIQEAVSSDGSSTVWIESTVAFHSPYVKGVESAVAEVVDRLLEEGVLFDESQNVAATILVTSVGGRVEPSALRNSKFWTNTVIKPLDLKGVMKELELICVSRSVPFFDLSPRGLFVNWHKRNAGPKNQAGGLASKTSPAMTYSFDFVRVLQHYRKKVQVQCSGEVEPEGRKMDLAPYPFRAQNCTHIPKDILVRGKEVKGIHLGSTYSRKTCLKTSFENLELSGDCSVDENACIGIELASDGTAVWNALWGPDCGKHRVVDASQDPETVSNNIGSMAAEKQFILLVIGPLGGGLRNGFEDAFSMEAPMNFIEKLQGSVVKDDSRVKGILFVTNDASHPGFEFVVGFFASLRFKLKHVRFVSTLRLPAVSRNGASSFFEGGTIAQVLHAVGNGESVLRITEQNELQGCRVVPATASMSWKFDWVKAECLYVVSGATSAVASTLLPTLAETGVRNFLLLVNRRQPPSSMVRKLFALGAKSVRIEACEITDEGSIRCAVERGLQASGATRVAGVWHLAGIAEDDIRLPYSKKTLKRVLNVKYEGQRALLAAIDLRCGDIFSVPGSISTIVGSIGVAYAATNFACRALQLHASRRLIAPFPVMGVSDSSIDKTSLGDVLELRKVVARTGISSVSFQVFDLALARPESTPDASGQDLILMRANPEILDEYLNVLAPNRLFSKAVHLEQDLRLTPIDEVIATTRGLATSTVVSGGSPMTSFENVEDALVSTISEVTGLSEDEVRENADPNAYLDEAFSIDSITSFRLGKRLDKLGYTGLSIEMFVSSTYGSLLEHMKANPPHVIVKDDNKTREDVATASSTVEMSDDELPVSTELMKRVAVGHDTVVGGIIPSLWYGIVSALVFNKNIKVVLHRMASLNTGSIKVMKETQGNRTMLSFFTSLPTKEPLLRAQATSTDREVPIVPLVEKSASPFFSIEGADPITRLLRQAGFDYKGPYRSLRKIDIYKDANEKDADDFSACFRVQAKAYIELSGDPAAALAETYFLSVDASFQAMFFGFGTMFAPAKFFQQNYVAIEDWPQLIKKTNGYLTISCRFKGAKVNYAEGIATGYVGNEAICSGHCTVKAFPVAIGSRCYPQFFCLSTAPRHTLLCFHGVSGTSFDYDSLADMMAPQGVRVLSVEFPHQGRRLQQSDDDVFTTMEGLKEDILPWLHYMLRGPNGELKPFSIVAMSGGGVCAYGLLRDCLVPAGLVPRAFITIASTPPYIPNVHIERTCQLSVENVEACMSYFAIVAGFDASGFDEIPSKEDAVDRLGCMLGPVHELTAGAYDGSEKAAGRTRINVPAYIFGIKNDPIVEEVMMYFWRNLFTRRAWKGIFWLGEEFNHFFNLVGQEKEVFRHVFFEHSVLEDILSHQNMTTSGTTTNLLRRVAGRLGRSSLGAHSSLAVRGQTKPAALTSVETPSPMTASSEQSEGEEEDDLAVTRCEI